MSKVATAATFHPTIRDEALAIVRNLGVPDSAFAERGLPARSPITGEIITCVRPTTPEEAKAAVGRAHKAFSRWRTVPGPRRGEFVRLLGH